LRNTVPNADSNTNRNSNCNGNNNCHANSYGYIHANTYGDSHSYAYTYSNGNTDVHTQLHAGLVCWCPDAHSSSACGGRLFPG